MKKLVALFLTTIAFCVCAAERPVVKVDTGSLQGAIEYGMQVFKDVPYAAPPVGDLRWRPPQPVLAWNGTRDASKFGGACPCLLYTSDAADE